MTATAAVAPLTAQIEEAVASGDLSLPPLPAIATRLLELLKEESRADSREVAGLVHHDPAVAASLLRMANSVAYGGLRPIAELSQAIARIGFAQVTSVVTSLLLKGHFDTKNPDKKDLLQKLWDHSVATAITAKHLASLTGGDGEESFLAGLLHDVGRLLVLKGLDQIQIKDPKLQVTDPVLFELMDTLHTDLGYRTLQSWKIPEPIAEAARDHHAGEDSAVGALLTRVQAADALTRKLGAHLQPDPEMNLLHVPAVERLNLNDLELATLLVDLEDELDEAKDMSAGQDSGARI